MCCGFALFTHAELTPDEVEPVLAAGGVVEKRSDATREWLALALPCVLWVDGRCSVYGTIQPQNCRDYKCQLLNQVEAGTRTLDDAMHVVEMILNAQREVVATKALIAAAELDFLIRRYLKP
jgi:hypothetical protein